MPNAREKKKGAMPLGRIVLWLLALLVLTLLVLYAMYPTLRDAVGEHFSLAHRQWGERHGRRPPPHPEAPAAAATTRGEDDGADGDEVAADDDDDEVGGDDDVVEYTRAQDAPTRVRVLHPQTPEARERVLQEGRDDPEVVRQTVVSSSTQYEGVSQGTPIVIQTYRPHIA